MPNPKLEKVDLNKSDNLKKSINTFVKEGLDIKKSSSNKGLKNINISKENELKDSIKEMIANDIESQTNRFEAIINFIIDTSKALNENNTKFYLTYFTLFFFLYYTLTAKYTNSAFDALYNRNKHNTFFLWFYYGGLSVLIISFLYYYSTVAFILNDKTHEDHYYTNYKFIGIGILVLFLFFNTMQVFFKYITIYLPDILLRIFLAFFYLLNILFLVFYFTIFVLNINKYYNVEALIALELLFFFYMLNKANVGYNKDDVFKKLKENNFTYLTTNCLPTNNQDVFDNNRETSIQNQLISKKYGIGFIQLEDNIPVRYMNKKTKNYEDLKLCDFYYPGSYYSYLGNSPLNGEPDLKALQLSLEKFKTRVITLDIFSNRTDDYDPRAEPIVRCQNMKEGAAPLKLHDCFELINKYAWLTNNGNTNSFPFILILNFHFKKNTHIYRKIYNLYIEYFSKYLIDKKYGFSGRNSELPISQAPMTDCLGKIILITNNYPTGSLLDEIINGVNSKNSQSFQLHEYKGDYVNFNQVGVSQDFNKNELVTLCKSNMLFFYSQPNKEYENKEQSKAGLFNPRFQDLAQYGVQGTLMYLFTPDNNLKDWFLFFKNKSNFDPVLKDEVLLSTEVDHSTTKKQNPVAGMQKDQKYCMIPGLFDTEKSNLSSGNSNISCQNSKK